MPTRFADKTAIVTGASRGIGLAIATRLVHDGANVVVTGRRPESLQAAVSALGGPEHALGIAGNAADLEHQKEVIEATVAHFGGVDMLINNTGINPMFGPMIEMDLAVARKIAETNCIAALSWAQHAYGAWMNTAGGAIVNVSSIAGLRTEPGIGFYGASKAMLLHITAELAVELGPRVRVNAVAPGVVKTKFAAAMYRGREETLAAAHPLKRLGAPEDIGGVVAFLLSEDAAWITGQVLTIDGGLTLTTAGQ